MVGYDSRERYRRTVDPRHKKSAEDDLVEGRIRTASQEAVKLHEELEVNIVTLRRLAVSAAHMMGI